MKREKESFYKVILMNYHNYQIGIKKAPTTWLNLDDEGIKRKIQSYTMSKVTTKEKKKMCICLPDAMCRRESKSTM